MERITNISITGYRGIKSLQLENLQRVNLFLGNNNCGKSSVLEAIMILLGANKPSLPVEMNAVRNYSSSGKDDFALFFHNLNVSNEIGIRASFTDESKRELAISYYEKERVKNIPIQELQHKNLSTDVALKYGLVYNYVDKGIEYRSSLALQMPDNNGTFSQSTTESTLVRSKAIYIAPRYDFGGSIKSFNKIITDKEKENVLEVLRHIEPGIIDVAVVDSNVMVDIGLERMIPINVLGDGIRKLFSLIIAMYDAKGGALLIDEIDNGLYYKSMQTLWRTMLRASSDLNVQIFATTHSKDSLYALKSIITEELMGSRKDVMMYTLRKGDDGVVIPYAYDYKMFNYVLEQEVDIR